MNSNPVNKLDFSTQKNLLGGNIKYWRKITWFSPLVSQKIATQVVNLIFLISASFVAPFITSYASASGLSTRLVLVGVNMNTMMLAQRLYEGVIYLHGVYRFTTKYSLST